jgi:hypothetical protein
MSATMVYRWRAPVPPPVDVDIIGREITRVCGENDGICSRADLLSAARPVQSPLHPAFEWDDRTAAEAHRLAQAGYLIRHVVTVAETMQEIEPVRAFVSVRTIDTDGGRHAGYISMGDAMRTSDYRHQMLAAARRDMLAFQAKYTALVELDEVLSTMRRIEKKIAETIGSDLET